MKDDLTQVEMMLLAAYSLWQEMPKPIEFADLVKRSWQLYPASFGLWPYNKEMPCSNTVNAGICGRNGILARGWLAKHAQRVYRLTEDGKEAARLLLEPAEVGAEPTADPMAHYLQSPLLTMPLHKITFAGACKFWGVQCGAEVRRLQLAIARVHGELQAAAERLENSPGLVGMSRYRELLNISRHCVDKFASLIYPKVGMR